MTNYPITCDESVMKPKSHGTSETPVQSNLRWGCDFETADRICNFNRHYAEHSGYFEETEFIKYAKATQGEIALENCHPFRRELWGRYWVFAHNGNLPDFNPENKGIFQPVGTTDSEKAFCLILNSLRSHFPQGQPPLKELYQTLETITQEIATFGSFNYILSDGEYFFTYCSTKLCYIIRQAPFAAAHLIDEEMTVDFSELTTPSDRVAVIVTTPLTDNEVWTPIQPGELLVFEDGLPLQNI